MKIENILIDELNDFLKTVNSKDMKYWIDLLINAFKETNNPIERNKLAIILSDYGGNLAVDPLIQMLKDPKTKGYRGTLLYALEALDYTAHLDVIFELLLDDNFEVSHQSFELIKNVLSNGNDNLSLTKKQISALTEKIYELQNRVDLYLSVLELLSH